MLSNSSKYALKGVLYLAVNASESKKILAKDVAKPINAPTAYTAKLLQELGRHGIVSSVKGPYGGFYLTEENMETQLIKIVDVIDGEQRLRSCMLSIAECDEENPCPLHHLIGDIKNIFIKNLEETTISQMVTEIGKGKCVLPL
ncbi:Rrf2 family transcriptional regulator [Muricauda sp. SCSIO 64092]|uniref:RrF2 family transcriptional regulator n=1 Tax=Allomuricauda sp. SCSIO 64092 TaxID=2908842 RepID=UPI001FF4C411|nr:Rrf2 family transcriptional regulator [Muricauda sp. SCSIO 64092]UOY07938.1 Rrf2 family transcriptional regulator [Muricauda sp. SCSIO 64092]